jgi:hypothetical protein
MTRWVVWSDVLIWIRRVTLIADYWIIQLLVPLSERRSESRHIHPDRNDDDC